MLTANQPQSVSIISRLNWKYIVAMTALMLVITLIQEIVELKHGSKGEPQ